MSDKLKQLVWMTGLATALSLGLSLVASVAYADDSAMELTISPVDAHYSVDPGSQISDTLTVLNSGRSAYDVLVYATPYSVEGPEYSPNFSNESSVRADAYKWISLSQTTYHLEPRQTAQIPYTIIVPSNASPGGHYSALFVEAQPGGSTAGLALKHRDGMITYVDVKGNQQLSGSVTGSTIDAYQPLAPLSASMTIKNSGNTDFPASMFYQVSNVFGGQMYGFTTVQYILPSTERAIPINWANSPWIGVYRVSIAATFLGKTVTKSAWVVVAPIWFVFLVVLLVLVGIVDVLRRKKRAPSQIHRR